MDIEPTEEEIIAEASFIEMQAYVKYCLYFGYGRAEITKALKEVGWTDDEIEKAFVNVTISRTKERKPTQDAPPPVNKFIVSEEMEAPKPSS